MSKQGVERHSLLIGIAYGLLYFGLRYSPSFLNLSAGLSYTVLLLVDRRYWRAIACAQVAATFAALAPQVSEAPYTLLWLSCATLAPISVALAATAFARRQWPIERLTEVSDVTRLLKAVALCSVASSLGGLVVFGTLLLDLTRFGATWPKLGSVYAMGTFLGTLSILPLACWYRQGAPVIRSVTGALHAVRVFAKTRREVLTHLTSWCLPFVVMTYMAPLDEVQWVCRVALFVPLVVFAAQGWKHVALAIPFVNLSLALTHSTAMREPNLMVLMEVSVLVWCMALVWGMHVGHHAEAADNARREQERYRKIAKSRELLPHLQRRHQAAELDRLYLCMTEAESALRRPDLDRDEQLRVWWSTIANARQQLRQMRERVYSPLLDEKGLRVALVSGPIALAVNKAGATFHSFVPNGIRRLSKGAQETVYHAVHEGAFQLLTMGTPKWMHVSVRTGCAAGRSWVAVKVRAELCEAPSEDGVAVPSSTRIIDLSKVARAYGGDCRQRRIGDLHSVSILIFDDAHESAVGTPFLKLAGG